MGTPTTKNLGLVKAIHVGNNPPVNILMLWYNTNPMINQHYYYDVITASWVSLAGGSILAINVSYDNSISLLTATNVQAAIDELDSILDGLSFAASNITYDPIGSGLTSTNVQDAIDEVVGLIPTVSYPVTNGSNGLNLEGTNIELGGTLNEDTTITTSTFYLDLFGNLRFRPSTLSTTSQNRTLQLANTTGAVSLVLKHQKAFRKVVYDPFQTISIPAPDGLIAIGGVNTTTLVGGAATVTDSVTQVHTSGTNDFIPVVTNGVLAGSLLRIAVGSVLKVRIKASIMPTTSDCIVQPLISYFPGAVPFQTLTFETFGGTLPKIISGFGYSEGTFCPQNKITEIESNFIYTYASSGYQNLAAIVFTRCLEGNINDSNACNIRVYEWTYETEVII